MSFTSGKTYGEYKHELTIQEMHNHAHQFNDCAWIDGKENIQSASNNSWFNGGYLRDKTHTGETKRTIIYSHPLLLTSGEGPLNLRGSTPKEYCNVWW